MSAELTMVEHHQDAIDIWESYLKDIDVSRSLAQGNPEVLAVCDAMEAHVRGQHIAFHAAEKARHEAESK